MRLPGGTRTMKFIAKQLPFGTASYEPIRAVRYVETEGNFEVEFDSGETFLVPRVSLLEANGLTPSDHCEPDSIWIDAKTRSGFFVRFTDGVEAEASWELVKELRP